MEYNLQEKQAPDNWKSAAEKRCEKEVPMSLFDDVKRNLGEWYALTTEKTSEVARVTTRRYDKFGISRDIERQFGELGSLIYNGLKADRPDLLDDDGVKALVERISGLETELGAKDVELESIHQEYVERKTEAAAAGGASAAVISDPILADGQDESAILVDPIAAENAVVEPESEVVIDIEDAPPPEKQG